MKELVEKACVGDEQAYAQIVQLHKTKLTAVAFSYTKDYMEAQDVVQESFLKAFQAIHQLKEPAYFSTWLYKIVIRQCYQHVNAKKRDANVAFELQQLQLISEEHSPHFDELYDALHLLKEPYKTVILLHYFYDFKLQEIAGLVDKPLNTVKIQLHRARGQLKKMLEHTKKDVTSMLHTLKSAALQYFKVPASFELTIEDVNEEGATFFWNEENSDEGYYIELTKDGKLLSLSQPLCQKGEEINTIQQQRIAEQFITSQYSEALNYFSLTKKKAQPDSTRFYYKQIVCGVPLQRPRCTVEISNQGQLLNFEYKPYKVQPPKTPDNFAAKQPIVDELINAEWQAQLQYLSSDYYTVPRSGLYVVYYSTFLYHSFDAATGADFSISDEDEVEEDTFIPLRQVEADVPFTNIEDIIGLPPTMELIRQAEMDDGYVGFVWRDKTIPKTTDKSMNQFITDRFEHTVKATVNKSTGELRGFVWFKERTGDLSLSFAQCEEVAVKFLHTYFPAFVPYLQMKVQEASFNEVHRASFNFQLSLGSLPLEGEYFMLTVNRTTGLVDMLMAPKIDVNILKQFQARPILPLAEAKKSLEAVDVVLQWDTRYEQDEPIEMLVYRYESRQLPIKYIDAVSGELILWKENV